ncbi:MAG: aminotransferase class IV [Deltaproteobacteria bacterium]|nr:aminotransferase class IV [Deltaproteobacteria bacterium]
MTHEAHPPILSVQEALKRLKEQPRPWAGDYLAMYSSWYGGIVTEPWLMQVPLDDHLVHRGDGVFEAMKAVSGRIYQMDRHLERLCRSAQSIFLDLPDTTTVLREICLATARAGGEPDCMVRLYVSRGPGGFSANPFECPEPGVYVVVGRIHPPRPGSYEHGVKLGISRVPAKSGFFASVKSCNYLPNVLLKREAVARGWEFSLGLDEEGYLAEGATENFGLVDREGNLCLPLPDHILDGTTVRRALELAPELEAAGVLAGVVTRPLSEADLATAREMMLFGTTLDVLPVTMLEERPVGDGRVGPVARGLNELIRRDILHNPEMSVPVFD